MYTCLGRLHSADNNNNDIPILFFWYCLHIIIIFTTFLAQEKKKPEMPSKYNPQTLQARVFKHFQKVSDDPNDHFYKCLISDKCRNPLNAKNKSNLVAHVKIHSVFYRKNYEIEASQLMSMPAKRLEFIQHCAELVTVNSEPFALLGKSGFLKLNKTKLQELKNAGFARGLSAPKCTAVKNHIKHMSAEIVKEIKEELKDKFITLMVDGATKYGECILGIYVQFMVDFEVIIRSIGMVSLTQRHTGEYLATVILKQLKLFEIKTSQLIAITTDNGTNMTTMIQHLNDAFGKDDDDDDVVGDDIVGDDAVDSDSSVYDDDCNDEDGANADLAERELETNDFQFNLSRDTDYDAILKNFVHEMEIEEMCNNTALQVLEIETNFDSAMEEMQTIIDSQTMNIYSIRCAAHTLQLAVMNGLATSDFTAIIQLCRAVCKELRNNLNKIELRENNIPFKAPRIDVKTRWNSTYSMVRCAITLRKHLILYF